MPSRLPNGLKMALAARYFKLKYLILKHFEATSAGAIRVYYGFGE